MVQETQFLSLYVSLRIEYEFWTSCFPFIVSKVLQLDFSRAERGRSELTNFLYGVSFIHTRAFVWILSERCAPFKQTSQSLVCTSHVGQSTMLIVLTTEN